MTDSYLPTFGWGTTPEPPYYAVIFTYQRTEGDKGYGAMAERMGELVRLHRGFLAVDDIHGTDGIGVVIAYFKDAESITKWKHHLEHMEAQKQGRQRWYKGYQVRVARVERAYGFEADGSLA